MVIRRRGDRKEANEKRSEEGMERRDENRVDDDGKTVHWSCAKTTEASRVSRSFFHRAGSSTFEKC